MYSIQDIQIKNSVDIYYPYREQCLSKEQLRALSRLEPRIVIRDVILNWSAIVTTLITVYTLDHWWMYLLASPIIGTRYYALYIIAHDGLHRRLFNRRNFNDRFNDVFILGPIGAITRINNKNHLCHHHSLGTEKDPDQFKYSCHDKRDILTMLGFLTGLTSVWRSVWNVFFRTHHPSQSSAPRRSHNFLDYTIILGWQAFLFFGLTIFFGPFGYLLLWLIPIYIFTVLADHLRVFCEHSDLPGELQDSPVRLIRFKSNKMERWFFAPMNMHLHVAHHLYPSIPYYKLPAAQELLDMHPLSKSLPLRNTYIGYIYLFLRTQIRRGPTAT